MVKNLPAMLETQVWSLDWEDPWEKGMGPRELQSIKSKESGKETGLSDYLRDFPGGPVVRIACFKCRGHGFHSWSGNKIPHNHN